MSGRFEVDQKIFDAIEKGLDNAPIFIVNWYYNLRASGMAATTCRDYISKVNRFLCYINGTDSWYNVKLEFITHESISRYLTSVQTKTEIKNGAEITNKTSDSYRQGVWSCLNNLCSFLYNSNLIKSNYIQTIKRPTNNDLERINQSRILLTENDFNLILNAVSNGYKNKRCVSKKLKNRDILMMLIFITTGIRKTALSEINIDDIDFDKKTICVIDKREKQHIYKISEKTMSALNDWLKDRKLFKSNTNALFITSKGNRIIESEIYKIVDKYCKEALGYHISPHKIRAGFCSVIYDKTGDIEFTRRAVGHSNIETTKRYIVTKNDEKEKSSKIIDDLINF